MIVIDHGHPQLEGLRLFMWPISPVSGIGWQQAAFYAPFIPGDGLDSTTEWGEPIKGVPTLKTGANSPATTTASYHSYWRNVWPSDDGKDFTVIAFVQSKSSNQSTFFAGARDPSNGGWLFGLWDNGGGDNGFAVFLYGGGSTWIFTDQLGQGSATQNIPKVVAFRYIASEQALEIWHDGQMVRRGTNTAATWTPYTPSTTAQLTIGRANSGFVFSGDVGPVMAFAGVMDTERLVALMNPDRWEFFEDDIQFFLSAAEATFATSITVGQSYTPSAVGAITFVTDVDADVIIDGDFTADPDEPTTATFVTAVQVGSIDFMNFPEFGLFTTTVSAASTITSTSPLTFVTSVDVSGRAANLVDGRADLIGTARYRR